MTTLRPILLVEDSAADIELTLVALKRAGSTREIVVVRDGVEALDYIFSEAGYAGRSPGPPAVILLDLKLPKINGLEVLERIKRDPIHRDIPIVMLTSSRQTSDITRSYRSGVNSYVVKPVDFAAFAQAIREIASYWTSINESLPPVTQ